jgi:hypothetical protein
LKKVNPGKVDMKTQYTKSPGRQAGVGMIFPALSPRFTDRSPQRPLMREFLPLGE